MIFNKFDNNKKETTNSLFLRRFSNSFKPTAKLHHFLINLNSLIVSLLFVFIYLGTIILFAVLYHNFKDHFEVNVPSSNSLFSFIYFSITVQTSIGFGDITPIGISRIIYSIHAVISFFENAILIGILLSRLIDRRHNIKCPSKICYIPPTSNNIDRNYFDVLNLWFMNYDTSSIYDVKYKLGITRYSSEVGRAPFMRYLLNLGDNGGFGYLSRMYGFLIGTKRTESKKYKLNTKNDENNFFSLKSSFENNTSIFSDPDTAYISVDIMFKSVDTNNEFFIRKEYHMNDIVCGKYAGLISHDKRKYFKFWKNRKYSNFGKFSSIGPDVPSGKIFICEKTECEMFNFCPLKKITSKQRKKLIAKKDKKFLFFDI